MGGLAGTTDGYVAVGATPIDADHDQGAALWSSDGLHWTQAPQLVARAGIVLASSGETWGVIGMWSGRSGFIAQGRVFAAPGAEIWWQSSDGRSWQKLTGYPPLGPTTGEGEGIGSYPSGYMASDGQRMLAEGSATWVSADGLHWSQLTVSGDLPAGDANQITLLPGGVLRVQPGPDGTSAWYAAAN
jgi:hypothetical protein